MYVYIAFIPVVFFDKCALVMVVVLWMIGLPIELLYCHQKQEGSDA